MGPVDNGDPVGVLLRAPLNEDELHPAGPGECLVAFAVIRAGQPRATAFVAKQLSSFAPLGLGGSLLQESLVSALPRSAVVWKFNSGGMFPRRRRRRQARLRIRSRPLQWLSCRSGLVHDYGYVRP